MIIRELVALLNLKVNPRGLNEFDDKIDGSGRKIVELEKKIKNVGFNFISAGKKLTLGLTAPIVALNALAAKQASMFEQLDVAFTTMLGSAEKAQKHIQELTTFAAETPFTIEGVFTSSRQLLAMGIEGEKIQTTLKALGDVAAGLSVPIGRLAFNFGQVKSAGRLTGRELRDFVTAGVPLLDTLGKMLNKNSDQIRNMISKGEISFDLVEKAFTKMSSKGGKFADLMQKQLKTLGGIFSNFQDIVQIVLAEFGKMVVVELKLKERFQQLTAALFKLLRVIKSLLPHQRKMLFGTMLLLAALGPMLTIIGNLIMSMGMLTFGTLLLKKSLFGATAASVGFQGSFLILPALIAAIIAAWLLLIDDLWGWANGADSWAEKSLGPFREWKANIVKDLKEFKDFFKLLIDFLIDNWKKFINFLGKTEVPEQLSWLTNIGKFIRTGVTAGASKLADFTKGVTSNVSSPFDPSFYGPAPTATARPKVELNINNRNVIDLTSSDLTSQDVDRAKLISDEIAKKTKEVVTEEFRNLETYNLLYE